MELNSFTIDKVIAKIPTLVMPKMHHNKHFVFQPHTQALSAMNGIPKH